VGQVSFGVGGFSLACFYRVSFTGEEGDLLFEYQKSSLVNFECASVLIEQLNQLFLIDGLPFRQGVAVRCQA
jgi:hypothetical protein